MTNQSFPELTKERIFDPLQMEKSTFQQPLPEMLVKYASAGHMNNGLPLEAKRYYYPHMAAGGLWSTTYDYAKYVIELQKSFHGESNIIIPQKLTEEMLSSQVADNYGLGVFIRKLNGEKNYFGHLGDNRGFFAGFISHIKDGYGAVVFTNSQNGASVIREITSGVAKTYGWQKYFSESYKIVELPEETLEKYCGRFLVGSDDLFEIKKEHGDLFLHRGNIFKLYHVGNNKFATKLRSWYLQFNLVDSQNISSVDFYIADELGRFGTSDPILCSKLGKDDKTPLELLNEGEIAIAISLYKILRSENPDDNYITENRFNRIGYNYLGKNKLEKAIAIFKLNVEYYPESANCYDSLGEAFMKNGEKELAY